MKQEDLRDGGHRQRRHVGGVWANYALSNNAYCESCANCGDLFFQYNMLAELSRCEVC